MRLSNRKNKRLDCLVLLAAAMHVPASWALDRASPACFARSGELQTPVIELYTSEGCSSCPPADQWLSSLKGKAVVAQAFHVSYWDYIGWVDRFASAANNARQRELAAANRLRGIYTPQLVRNGRDSRDYAGAAKPGAVASVQIEMQSSVAMNQFEARIEPQAAVKQWAAYWTVTEDGHQSRATSGENAGVTLKHDYVVRQYVPVGQYEGVKSLRFTALAAQAPYPRRVNLVVFDPRTLEPLQALSVPCN
jgi:hypothetical protein